MDRGDKSAGEAVHVLVASPRLRMARSLKEALGRERDIRVPDSPIAHPAELARYVAAERPRVLVLDTLLFEALEPGSLQAWHETSWTRVLLWCDVACAASVERVLMHRLRGFLLTNDPPALCLKAILAVDRGELWLPRALLADALLRHLSPPASRPADAQAYAGAPRLEARLPLTPREAQIVDQLRLGATNKEIARQLGIMEDTVKKHLQSVFNKLGVHRRSLVVLRQLSS